jgi:hypothetical protein
VTPSFRFQPFGLSTGAHSRQFASDPAATVIRYSERKMRTAALIAIVAAAPAFASMLSGYTTVHLIALAYLLLLLLACAHLRWLSDTRRSAVIVSDWGITISVHGLQLRWQDVKRIPEVRTRSAKAIDIELRWPETFSAHSSRAVRFGAWCQCALKLPAITLSLWLVEADAKTFLDAVCQHRPDLLHVNNRPVKDM